MRAIELPTKTKLTIIFGITETKTMKMIPRLNPSNSDNRIVSMESKIEFLIEI